MAKRVTLTNQGLSLLASSSEATGQYYWLGYYAMAYVPNLWKNNTVSIPVDNCGKVNNGHGVVEIQPTDTDKITPTMTRLTKYGDMIYNIWQGDLNGTGYVGCSSDGSPGGDLFALTMYNTNIKKHYRYVLDENGNNTLVGWIKDPIYTDGTMLGKHVFKGTDGYVSSTLPIPAPLYYLGDVTGKTSVDSFFNSLPTFEDEDGTSGNGASIYPFITVTLKSNGNPTLNIPRVSADYRGYSDSQGNPGTFNYGGSGQFTTPITTPGTYFNITEIPYPLDHGLGFDETSWFAADQTFNVSGSTATDSFFSEEFWKLHTISNYNRYHAPVDNIGHVLNSDLSNRNIAKTTKLFPISNYKVINSESGFRSNSDVVEVATAIKLSIDIDITPPTLNQGFDQNCQLNEQGNIQFFEKYSGIQPEHAVDEYGNNIYKSTHTSFKFNRIGIYAVPLRKAPYVSQDQGFGNVSSGNNVELQFQINPDEEPILYAVIDWDNTISMSDTGDGITQFRAEVDVNLESPLGVDDTALIRNTTIFYNMYEDDALRWYQNQLISTASTLNAITEIGLEVAHIKNNKGISNCSSSPDFSAKYAPMNHSHDFLRNLRDSNNSIENGIKGTITTPEGTNVDSQIYRLGNASVTLGDNNAVLADRSVIANGLDNYILNNSNESAILNGYQNHIKSNSQRSIIIGGEQNTVNAYAILSFIGNGSNNNITDSNNSGILIGSNHYIKGTNAVNNVNRSLIASGSWNRIEGVLDDSTITSGRYNKVTNSNVAFIGAGDGNILSNSNYTFIGSGYINLMSYSNNSFIGAGTANSMANGAYTFIGAGAENVVLTSNYIFIGSGKENSIEDSEFSFIGAGMGNFTFNTHNAFIGAGILNTLTASSDYSFIGAGSENVIANSNRSAIVSGSSNYIGVLGERNFIGAGNDNSIFAYLNNIPSDVSYSGIISGNSNNISSSYSFIGAGSSNSLNGIFTSVVGGNNNYIAINGEYSFIGGGSGNSVNCGYSSVLGGISNYITINGAYSVIGGGEDNYIGADTYGDPVYYASILGGFNNSIIDGANYSAVLGGRDTVLDKKNEIGFSGGAFKDGNDNILAYNKNSKVMLRGVTTVVNPMVYLSFENTGTQDFQIKRGEGFAGTISIMGYMQNVFTPDTCELGFRTMDVVYHELHSISGVYTKNITPGAVETTAISGLSYNEYDRYTKPAALTERIDTELDITGFTTTAQPMVTSPVVVTVTSLDHGLVTGSMIKVTQSSDPTYNTLPTPIVYVNDNTFQYTVIGPISDPNPTKLGTTGTYPTVHKVEYTSPEIPHSPSIVDTVLDYRYTTTPGYHDLFGQPRGDAVQSVYPKIQMNVGMGGTGNTVSFLVDANPLHTETQIAAGGHFRIVDSPIYWVATLDLTWIQIQ